MKTERKLKRGLVELSRLFLPAGGNGNGENSGVLTIRPYFSTAVVKPKRFTIVPPEELQEPAQPEHLICASMIPLGTPFSQAEQIRLAEALQETFETFYFLFPVPAQTESRARFHSPKEHMMFGFMSDAELREVLKPKPADHLTHSESPKRSLVLFDPGFLDHPEERMFSFLDHCVFVLPVDYEQLVLAYQLMQHCLARNPNLRCSLFLTGKGAKTNWDFVYERFCEIVSHFLGCDLGFLGWREGEEIRLNRDLLLEESGGAVQPFVKKRLSALLAQSVARV